MYDTRVLRAMVPFSLFRAGPGDEAALKTNKQICQMAKTYDFLFRFFLVGDREVGKTCMLTRYAEDTFNSTYSPTIGELSCFHCTM